MSNDVDPVNTGMVEIEQTTIATLENSLRYLEERREAYRAWPDDKKITADFELLMIDIAEDILRFNAKWRDKLRPYIEIGLLYETTIWLHNGTHKTRRHWRNESEETNGSNC